MTEAEALLRLTLAAIAGGVIGLDREIRDKPAGLRTNSLVAAGAALFTLVGLIAFGDGDPGSRLAAQVVTGVGFLGAGAIIQQRDGVRGLTTAAGIWGAAAVGMAFGAGLFVLGGGGTVLLLAVLTVIGVVEGRIKGTSRESAGEPDDPADS